MGDRGKKDKVKKGKQKKVTLTAKNDRQAARGAAEEIKKG